jgi:hypothetical protein
VNNAVREKISYVKNRAYGVGSLDPQSQYLSMWAYGISQWNRFLTTKKLCLAKVVGSTPTQSTFINLVKYGIVLCMILTIVGQNPTAVQIGHTSSILWIDFKATKTLRLSLKGEMEVLKVKLDRTLNLCQLRGIPLTNGWVIIKIFLLNVF